MLEQSLGERRDPARGRQPELVAQQAAQVVVDAKRLGDVPTRGVDLHQQRVRALAIRLALDELAGVALSDRKMLVAQRQSRAATGLEERDACVDKVSAA